MGADVLWMNRDQEAIEAFIRRVRVRAGLAPSFPSLSPSSPSPFSTSPSTTSAWSSVAGVVERGGGRAQKGFDAQQRQHLRADAAQSVLVETQVSHGTLFSVSVSVSVSV